MCYLLFSTKPFTQWLYCTAHAQTHTLTCPVTCSLFLVAVGSHRGARPVSAPVFSQAALAEAGIPLAPLEHPQTSTPVRGRLEERRLEVTVETVEPSKTEGHADDKVTDHPPLLAANIRITWRMLTCACVPCRFPWALTRCRRPPRRPFECARSGS